MDQFISNLIREYHQAIGIGFGIVALICAWVGIAGAIRFGIAIYRRKKGIYPPATSQMEHH